MTAATVSRRAAIVEATLRVIGERGADAVTHRAVAAEAGVALASTTYYFASKDALVREAFELAIDRSLALVETHAAGGDGSVVDRLVALAEAQLADTSAPLAAQFELMLEAGRRPQLHDLAARWDEHYRAAVATLVGGERRRGCGDLPAGGRADQPGRVPGHRVRGRAAAPAARARARAG